MPGKLVFVYNADSGILNAVMDSAHKLISPSTYSCSLCALTYHTFGEKKLWKKFRKESSLVMDFLHKDEFENRYPDHNHGLPVIFYEEDSDLTMIMTDKELNSTKDLRSLIVTLTQRYQTNLNR